MGSCLAISSAAEALIVVSDAERVEVTFEKFVIIGSVVRKDF